jgi:prenylcysteine oxidase/farnesylcysteine lyase
MGKESNLRKLSRSSAFPFQSIEEVVVTLDLTDELSMSGDERLRENGISEKYETEMLAPETRRRLSQEIAEINDLALSTAVYDLDQGTSQAGGHVLPVLEDMVVDSGAYINLGTEVVGLHQELVPSGKLEWIVRSHNEIRGTEYLAFQKVILAAPWYPATLEVHAELEQQPQELEYRQRHVTFFTSQLALSSDLFGSEDKLPNQILPTMIAESDKLHGIHEIAFVRELTRVIDGKAIIDHLYRILSVHEIDDEFLSSLFNNDQDNPSWVYKGSVSILESLNKLVVNSCLQVRHAYPLLYPRTLFPPMALSDSLWHAGALEAVASSLDMSLFAGANVGALAFAQIRKEQA